MAVTRATRSRPKASEPEDDRLGPVDPSTRFLYTPHTVAFLLLILLGLVFYTSPLNPERRPDGPEAAQALAYSNAKEGVWGLILVFLGERA